MSALESINRLQASETVLRMVEDLRDVIRNEEAWAIGERYKRTIEEQYQEVLDAQRAKLEATP